MKAGKILIVGGYGGVGSTIAKMLYAKFPQRIVVAGRSLEKAQRSATNLGPDASALELDIRSHRLPGNILDGIDLAVMCVDQHGTTFVEQCISRGIDYIDITASYDFLSKLEKLDAQAKTNGSTVILSVGLAPGLTNLLASYVRSKAGPVEHIDLFIMLGLGEKHGKAAVRWTVANLNKEFSIRGAGGKRKVRAFHEGRRTCFPGGLGARWAYRFDFSDQHVIPRTLGLEYASTWLCFESAFVTELLALLERVRILRLLGLPALQNVLVSMLRSVHSGSDIFVLKAEAHRHSKTDSLRYECGIMGNGEGHATGIVASKVVSLVYSSPVSTGVFHVEQVVKPDTFLQGLQAEGMILISDGIPIPAVLENVAEEHSNP